MKTLAAFVLAALASAVVAQSSSTSTRDVIVQSGAISFTNFENLRVVIDDSGSGQCSQTSDMRRVRKVRASSRA